jgi:hypothetical protein
MSANSKDLLYYSCGIVLFVVHVIKQKDKEVVDLRGGKCVATIGTARDGRKPYIDCELSSSETKTVHRAQATTAFMLLTFIWHSAPEPLHFTTKRRVHKCL